MQQAGIELPVNVTQLHGKCIILKVVLFGKSGSIEKEKYNVFTRLHNKKKIWPTKNRTEQYEIAST